MVEKYEKSKSFSGENKVNQSFVVIPDKLFKSYGDHSNYEVFESVNEAVGELEALGYVLAARRGTEIVKVQMRIELLDKIYEYLGRVPKDLLNKRLKALFEKYSGVDELMDSYIEAQRIRLSKNQKVQGYKVDVNDFEDLMLAIATLLKLTVETYERDFSVRLFADSKRFKSLEARLVSILYEYGDYPTKEGILGELNLLKNPTYVYVKGAGRITFGDQSLDLSQLPSDIALSSENLAKITSVTVSGDTLMTIENLTSFHSYKNTDQALVVYLGGFHNSAKRGFLKQVYQDNSAVDFLHFGDIDIGGILIFEHLKRKTGIPFSPYEMMVENLVKYKKMTKPLTENDRKRSVALMDTSWHDLLEYMLSNDCKLEQEAIDL